MPTHTNKELSNISIDKASRPEVISNVLSSIDVVPIVKDSPQLGEAGTVSEETTEQVRRKTPKCPGVYVKGNVHGIPLWVTADTGASKTVMSKAVFDKIPSERQPCLRSSPVPLDQAGGSPLQDYGSAELRIELGSENPLALKLDVTVADIKDEMLLGMDAGDTFDVMTSKGKVIVDGHEVPCVHIRRDGVRKVFVSRRLEVPGNSEAILEATVESHADLLEDGDGDMIIEPTPYFSERNQLVMAASLVDLNKGARVRVMNPYSTPVTLHKGTLVGYAQPFIAENCLADQEDEDELMNQGAVRRIKYCKALDEVQRQEPDTAGLPVKGQYDASKLPDHLSVLFQEATQDKSVAERGELATLLEEFQDVFSKDEYDLGFTHLAEHSIETGDARPVKQPPRKVPIAMAGEEKAAIDQMKKQGIIQESSSPWASPIVLVRKKNGKIRPCVDYRRLNSVTIKDAYPIPTTQECLDAMAGSVYFSTLDMTSGYNQIPVKESDIPKTAFVTKHGLFEYKAMSFGLTNAPATFQRVMELALKGLQWTTCLIYLDDVIIFGSSFREHIVRLRQVLDRVRKAGLKLKPEKCALLQREVPFLGHIVSGAGVRPNPDNVAKIMDWPEPTSVTEVRQFLGLCSYYRRFIRNFSVVAKPLTNLTCKDSPLVWDSKCQTAFDELKSCLTGPEIMAYPKAGASFILDTDACDVGIGAVLSQVSDGQEKVIAYASRTLNRAERNYCVTDKELLAVKHFIEYFRQYLLGTEFTVRTDHQALKWLFSLKEPKGRIARWIEILSAYHFRVEYRQGRKHANADALSRCPNPRACACDNQEPLQCGPCKKCLRRSETMYSPGEENVRAVSTHGSPLAEGVGSCAILVYLLLLYTSGRRATQQVVLFTLALISAVMGCVLDAVLLLADFCFPLKSLYGHLGDDGRLWPKLKNRFHGLSRGCLRKVTTRSQVSDAWFQVHSKDKWRKQQEDDPSLSQVLAWMEAGERPFGKQVCTSSPEVRHYWTYWGSLEMHDGLLYKKFHRQDGTSTFLQLLVPKSLRSEVLKSMHDSVMAGHLGQKKTWHKTFQRFYWFEMKEDVGIYVRKCDTCAVNKADRKKPKAPLGKMQVGAPLDRICVDLVGPFPESEAGNRYILVATDAFTKWVELVAIPNQLATTCAQALLESVVSKFGCPLDLHTDQGRSFENEVFAELCKLCGVRKTRTTPYHPQGNGQVERFNRTLLQMIRSYVSGDQTDWDQNLACLGTAYRASVHESTGFTPNMLMLGREVRLPGEVTPTGSQGVGNEAAYVEKLRAQLDKAHSIAREHLGTSAKRQSLMYDVKCTSFSFQPGDRVWLLSEARREGVSPKLSALYTGPHIILAKLSDITYQIRLHKSTKVKVVHHNKLKPYQGDKLL